MKKVTPLTLAGLLACFSVNAQETRTFNVSEFNKLDLGSAMRIEVRQGDDFSAKATGTAKDLDDLEANVEDGQLQIGYRDRNWNTRRKEVQLEITMPELSGVDFSGACQASVEGFENGDEMDIDVSGASEVQMDFSAREVSVDLSGASSLSLNGGGEGLNADLSGASSLDATDFSLKSVEIEASGASSAKLSVSESISADASGASSIRYSGGAREVHVETSSAGSVAGDD